MTAPWVDPMTGWLGSLLGDTWLRLVRGSPEENLLRHALGEAIETVIGRADPSSREELRKGLSLCFNEPPKIPVEPNIPLSAGLRAAVEAQVSILRTMVSSDREHRPFFEKSGVDPDWLTNEIAGAFLVALRSAVATSGPLELVHALNAEEVRLSLHDIRQLIFDVNQQLVSRLQFEGERTHSESERPQRVRVGVIPRRAECFQRRELYSRLEGLDFDERPSSSSQVLIGMGGVGKTQLAAAYARHAWQGELRVLVWVTASSRSAIVEAYAAAAVRLELADGADLNQAAQEFLVWTETTEDSWLVIIDDVRNPSDIRNLLPSNSSSGKVVITTRRRDAALIGGERRIIEVGLFERSEANAYLRARLGNLNSDDGEIDALALDLGYLPLALAQAAAFILDQDVDLPRYRRLFAERLLEQVVPETEALPDNHERIVAATWDLSVEQADQVRPAGIAKPLLQLTSLLDSNGIPSAVLASRPALEYIASCVSDSSDFDWRLAEEQVDETLRVLHRFSLISHDRSAEFQEVRVHQLVQRATREGLARESELGPFRLISLADTVADALLAFWPELERDEPTQQIAQALRANTTALRDTAGPALFSLNDEAHPVLFRSAGSLADTGQIRTAIAEYKYLKANIERYLSASHPDFLMVRNNLAFLYGEAGEVRRAAAAYEQIVADYEHLLGIDDPNTMTARQNLARWRGEAGDTDFAVAAFERILADRRRVLGPDHPHTLSTHNNLVNWRGRAGDARGAAADYRQIVADYERVLGANHPDTLAARANLAGWIGEAGDAVGASNAFERLFAETQEALGADHPHTLSARLNLEHWRGKAGDVRGTTAAYERIVADYMRVLGPDHPITLIAQTNLLGVRGEAGETVSVEAFESILADQIRVLGADHPTNFALRVHIATMHGEDGEVAHAITALEETLADCEGVLGPNHLIARAASALLVRWRERL